MDNKMEQELLAVLKEKTEQAITKIKQQHAEIESLQSALQDMQQKNATLEAAIQNIAEGSSIYRNELQGLISRFDEVFPTDNQNNNQY